MSNCRGRERSYSGPAPLNRRRAEVRRQEMDEEEGERPTAPGPRRGREDAPATWRPIHLLDSTNRNGDVRHRL